MIVKIEFEYSFKVTQAELDKLKTLMPSLRWKNKDEFYGDLEGKEYEEYMNQEKRQLYTHENHIVDLDLLAALNLKLEFKIVEFIPIKQADTAMTKLVNIIPQLMLKLDAQTNDMNAAQTFNERCQVHLPGLGLLTIDEVMNLDDFCTDDLNDYLEKGWRIVACCPQPDQRRPDYILGRTKPQED